MNEHCLACQMQGGCALSTSTEPDYYEAHVTVVDADVSAFREACAVIGVKPILLDLQLRSGGVMKDLMTSSKFKGTYAEARAYVDGIAEALTAEGFVVVRKKLETTPWNVLTPAEGNGVAVAEGRYFESHLPVRLHENDRPALAELAHALGFHLSRNTFKALEDGVGIVMMTVRSYEGTIEAFQSRVEAAKATLAEHGFAVEKTIVEYAIYDTKVAHDAAWTS